MLSPMYLDGPCRPSLGGQGAALRGGHHAAQGMTNGYAVCVAAARRSVPRPIRGRTLLLGPSARSLGDGMWSRTGVQWAATRRHRIKSHLHDQQRSTDSHAYLMDGRRRVVDARVSMPRWAQRPGYEATAVVSSLVRTRATRQRWHKSGRGIGVCSLYVEQRFTGRWQVCRCIACSRVAGRA